MALADGAYIIVNANSGKVLDVKGGSEKSGANVQQYTANGTDAQKWAVTSQTGGTQIMCSLTGRVLDVSKGTMANGANVQQWGDNDSEAQRWVLTEDGKTATYGGKTYPTYVIKSAKDETFAIDVKSASTADGANVQIYKANNTNAQRWMFVPVMAMTTGGTYEIVSALDTSLCVDISAASTANGAKAQVYTRNGTNAQIFEAEVNTESQLVRLAATHSGKALDSDGAESNGTKVHQWAKTNNNDNQWWLIERNGTATVGGQKVPTYRLITKASSGRCMDVAGAKKAAGTQLQMYEINGSAAQRFAFIKTEMLGASIPAPTNMDAVVQGRGELEHELSFYCDEKQYQARYRVNTYSADHKSVVNGGWHSLDDVADIARDGWGDAWEPTFKVSQSGNVTIPTAADAVITPNVCDKIVYDIEVRAFRSSYGSTKSKAHGPVTRSTVVFTLQPELTIKSVRMTAKGAEIALSCDYPHAGNRYGAEIWMNGERIARRETVTGSGSATVKIPLSSLGRILLAGDEVEVRASVITADGGSDSKRENVNVTYAGGAISAPTTITYDADTLSANIACPNAVGGTCFLEVTDGGNTRLVECLELADGVWRVPYPFGVHWRVAILRDAGSGMVIGTAEGDAPETDEYVWLWGETWEDCLRLRANADDRPRQSRSHGTDSATAITTGRTRPITFGGTTVSLDLWVHAATFGDTIPHSTRADVERLTWSLGDGWYPVFRSPKGDWHRVAVTEVETGWDNGIWSHAQVKQEAVEL